MALAAGAIPRRRRLLRALLALSVAIGASLEGEMRRSRRVRCSAAARARTWSPRSRRSGGEERTLCLLSHLDSSRSGLMFDPRVTPHLGALLSVFGLAFAVCGAEPVLGLLAVPAGASPSPHGALLGASGERCWPSARSAAWTSPAPTTTPRAQRSPRSWPPSAPPAPLAEHPRRAADHRQRGGQRDRLARFPRGSRHLRLAVPQLRRRRGAGGARITCSARAAPCAAGTSDPGLRSVAERVARVAIRSWGSRGRGAARGCRMTRPRSWPAVAGRSP